MLVAGRNTHSVGQFLLKTVELTEKVSTKVVKNVTLVQAEGDNVHDSTLHLVYLVLFKR